MASFTVTLRNNDTNEEKQFQVDAENPSAAGDAARELEDAQQGGYTFPTQIDETGAPQAQPQQEPSAAGPANYPGQPYAQ